MSNITLQIAKTSDIPAIVQLYIDTVLVTCAAEYDLPQREVWASLGRNEKRWEGRIKSQYFLISRFMDDISGFGSLSAEGYLDVFYIHKDHQRKGIATALYNALEAEAVRLSLKTINADVSKTAKPFFEKKGFSAVKTQKNFIQGQVLINYKMEKQLPEA